MSLSEKEAADIREQVRITEWKREQRRVKYREEFQIHLEAVEAEQKPSQTIRRESSPKKPVQPDWAVVLGVLYPCSLETVRAAYKKRQFETHPDRNSGDAKAFHEVRRAFEQALNTYGVRV